MRSFKYTLLIFPSTEIIMSLRMHLIILLLTISLFANSMVSSPSKAVVRKSSSRQEATTSRNTDSRRGATAFKQDFLFMGCPGNEQSFKEVTEVLIDAQNAWNNHQIDGLIKHYALNFTTKDGMNLDKIRKNLNEFWLEYPDAKIKSFPATVQVCGNYATVTLTEVTTGTGQVEDAKVLPYPAKFKGWIQGLTTLKKVGASWKISSEEIISEQMWKYYGPMAEELLEKGKIKLIIPTPIHDGENYIAQLKYSLPERVQASALIDRVILDETRLETKESEADRKEKIRAIEAIRRPIEGETEEGLRRLFTVNSLEQDELVRAQVELVSFTSQGPILSGVLGLSERVVPRSKVKSDQSNKVGKVTQSLKEEVLGIEQSASKEKVKG